MEHFLHRRDGTIAIRDPRLLGLGRLWLDRGRFSRTQGLDRYEEDAGAPLGEHDHPLSVIGADDGMGSRPPRLRVFCSSADAAWRRSAVTKVTWSKRT